MNLLEAFALWGEREDACCSKGERSLVSPGVPGPCPLLTAAPPHWPWDDKGGEAPGEQGVL